MITCAYERRGSGEEVTQRQHENNSSRFSPFVLRLPCSQTNGYARDRENSQKGIVACGSVGIESGERCATVRDERKAQEQRQLARSGAVTVLGRFASQQEDNSRRKSQQRQPAD